MAMSIKLRSKAGADMATVDLSQRTEYPEVIISDGVSYVLKRVMPDKQSAFYYEAIVVTLPEV